MSAQPEYAQDSTICTASPAPQFLSDMEIAEIYAKWDATPGVSMADFARAVEAAQPKRQPLSDEQMLRIIDDELESGSLLDVARAVEKAHGIGGDT